jgi:putative spermidine/putrescine transport system permease protein
MSTDAGLFLYSSANAVHPGQSSLLLKGIGQTTLPVQLYDYLRWDFDPIAAAVSSVSILITLVIVLLTDRIVGLRALRF